MIHKTLNILLTAGVFILAGAIFLACPVGFADSSDTPDIQTCTQYLNLNDADFEALIKNKSKAISVAATLTLCLKNNVCNNLSTIQNCAALHANRTFLSDYFAHQINPTTTENRTPQATPLASANPILTPIKVKVKDDSESNNQTAETTGQFTNTQKSDSQHSPSTNVRWY